MGQGSPLSFSFQLQQGWVFQENGQFNSQLSQSITCRDRCASQGTPMGTHRAHPWDLPAQRCYGFIKQCHGTTLLLVTGTWASVVWLGMAFCQPGEDSKDFLKLTFCDEKKSSLIIVAWAGDKEDLIDKVFMHSALWPTFRGSAGFSLQL